MNISASNLRNAFITLANKAELVQALAELSPGELDALLRDWQIWARPDQLPPNSDWFAWLVMGGRGSGKTRTGAEWVRGVALGRQPYGHKPVGRIALIGQSIAEVREVMIEGVSGILAVHARSERPTWQPSRRRLEWSNGCIAQVFSAEDPEGLRGPQFHVAWSDELAKWRYPDATWDMLQFGLRLGERPRQVITTTPRPIPLLKKLMADVNTKVTRSATAMNAPNLASGFLETIVGRYGGSRLGRQELDGELIEDRENALWSRSMLDALRAEAAPSLSRVVVAIDPPASSSAKADGCGIIGAGVDENGIVFVLKDSTIQSVKPLEWARKAINLYHQLEADSLVAEVNQGGEMVTTIIQEVDSSVPVQAVRATRGKWIRAEPVAALYDQGRVRHVGQFAALEDEMCDFGLDGLSSGRSPDRVDALVWALSTLLLGQEGVPRIRQI